MDVSIRHDTSWGGIQLCSRKATNPYRYLPFCPVLSSFCLFRTYRILLSGIPGLVIYVIRL